MPVKVEKRGNKYCVVGPDGKLEGKCFSDKEKAVKQVQAINLSKRRKEGKPAPPAPKAKSGVELIAEARIKVRATDLGEENGLPQASVPIIILSDGTPEGTKLIVHGQPVDFSRMDLYCNREGDYKSCSLSITQRETGPDGQTIERTMTLRKESEDNKENV